MPLFVKDPEVGKLADRLAALKGVTKTEAVRQALRAELKTAEAAAATEAPVSPYVRRLADVVEEFQKRHGPPVAKVDKAWIDSLYED